MEPLVVVVILPQLEEIPLSLVTPPKLSLTSVRAEILKLTPMMPKFLKLLKRFSLTIGSTILSTVTISE